MSNAKMGPLVTTPWVSRLRPAATEPGLKPGSVVAQLEPQCSALDHCPTQEAWNEMFDEQVSTNFHVVYVCLW